MPKLTKRLIDGTDVPATGQRFLRDDELPGFALRITRGSKSFIVEKRIQGRPRRFTLGPYGPLTLEAARRLALAKIGEIAQGQDPAQERQQRTRSATFGELAHLYLERHGVRKKSKAEDESILNHHLSHWRSRKLSAITRADVARLHTTLGTTPSSIVRPGRTRQVPIPIRANRTVTLLSTMFTLAQDWGLHPGPNPANRIRKFPEVKRDRFVTPDELPRLWGALQQEPNPFIRGAFVVALLTGARRSEVLSMRWDDLDVGQGVWRIPETKVGRPHRIPLPRTVMEELLTLPRLAGNPHVFVGRWNRSHLVNVSKPWRRIRKEAGLNDVRIHDLRRTLGSWLVAAGASLPLIGKALNHSQPSTTAIYARMDLDPVRLALDANATKMLTVIEQARQQECGNGEAHARS